MSSLIEGKGFPAKKDLLMDCALLIMARKIFPVLKATVDAWRKWVAHV